MYENTLHERLTKLLMDNGCSVTKTSIDKLIGYIAERDHQILGRVIRDTEKTLAELQRETFQPKENEL